MAIFRVNKDASNPFMIINKQFIEDERLSLKAKGLMCYFLSKPDVWEFYIEEIKKHTKDKEAAITSAIKELMDAGYIKRFRKRKSGKFLGGYTYDVFEVPDYDMSRGVVESGQKITKTLPMKGIKKRDVLETPTVEDYDVFKGIGEDEQGDEEGYEILEESSCDGQVTSTSFSINEGHQIDEETETGKFHSDKNTDMGFYRYGEKPRWENPVLLNNDFNNNNDFNSNNEIYTSDFKESEELSLVKYLFNHIKNNNPKAKEPNLDKWSKAFKLILRNDQRDFEEVKRIIELSQKHHFWYKNILSPEALRKQYDRLLLEFEEKKKTKKNEENHAGSFGDYKQRTYDFEKLERRLLGWS